MRKYFLLLGITLFFQHSNGTPPRKKISLDFNWKFSQSDTIGADKEKFNDSKWRALDLPHDWSIENEFNEKSATGGGGGYLPTGVGWYRKEFVLPKTEKGKNILIEFEGVYMNSDVWINGHHLGHYPNGYMSFYYDLTPFIKSGKNIIAVRVDNSLQPNTRWYSGSGIYRHVWLHIADPLHIAHWGTYVTTPSPDAKSAVIVIKSKIENRYTLSQSAILRSMIVDVNGNEVAKTETSFNVNANTSRDTLQRISISDPHLWSLEDPYLYTVHQQIINKGKLIDEFYTIIGIRKIEYETDKGFFLNGKHVKLNGVCLHHDGGSVGSAVPEAVWIRRLTILKEMGCNAIRTAHNPVAPAFLDLCDKMGFLVQDEIFDVWKSGKVKYDYANYFDQWSQHDLVNFIHRDRNHPSIVMWSAGNEIGEQKQEKGYEVLRALIETFHREDNTRPVTTGNDNIAADNGMAKIPFLQMLDIVGYNYVDRWHERRELFYSIDKQNFPHWKMTGTESVSIPGVRGNYYGGNFLRPDSSVIRPAFLASVIRAEQLWKFVSSHDYVIGDFMWTGIDYLGEARWPNKNASSGVIDLCGFPKDGYYFYQSQWTTKPMIHLSPHWNWKGNEGKVIPVMAYTNCDSVELFLNGRSFGIKALDFPRQGNSGAWNRYDRPQINTTTADLHLIWDVPYEPGTIKAVGRKNNQVVCEAIIQTTGIPASIKLSVDRESINADTRDVAHVKIEIQDENGLTIPDANNLVTLMIEGNGKLIGFDNGNPQDHTSMKSNQRKAFNGLALAIIQAYDKPGEITVTAKSETLKAAVIRIKTIETIFPFAKY